MDYYSTQPNSLIISSIKTLKSFFGAHEIRKINLKCLKISQLFWRFSLIVDTINLMLASLDSCVFLHASLPNWILIKKQTELTKRRVQRRSHIELKFSFTKLINWIISIRIFIGVWWWNFFLFIFVWLNYSHLDPHAKEDGRNDLSSLDFSCLLHNLFCRSKTARILNFRWRSRTLTHVHNIFQI